MCMNNKWHIQLAIDVKLLFDDDTRAKSKTKTKKKRKNNFLIADNIISCSSFSLGFSSLFPSSFVVLLSNMLKTPKMKKNKKKNFQREITPRPSRPILRYFSLENNIFFSKARKNQKKVTIKKEGKKSHEDIVVL